MVPQLADLCTVELLGADGLITPVAVVHVNPAKLPWLQQLRDLYPPQFADAYGIGQVLRTGRSASYPVILEERLLAVAPDQTYKTILQQVGFKSVLIVPLQVRDQILGALTLAWSDTDRHYAEADLHLAEEVAARAALAVDNARLYQAARAAESDLRQLNESLEQRVAARLPTLVSERVPLEMVLRNLISNALKHHHHPQTGQVTVSATEQATFVEFAITDDGPGIAPQYHDRIFQMFQTLKPRDQVEGSGMGLATVKKLVESYGGNIHVDSRAGQGATFRFTWPKTREA